MKTYFSRRQVLSYSAAAIASTGFNTQAQSPTKIIFVSLWIILSNSL